MSLSSLSLRTTPDHVLLDALERLTARDSELEAELLVHLGEVDARGLALAKGFRSLHAYCVEVLHFSESVAFHRITAARAARRFPEVLERIRSGELHLSGLRLLEPHLTTESCTELLDLARHQSKRAIEEKLADRAPKPDVPALVRRLPEPVVAERVVALDALPSATAPVPPSPTQAPVVARIEVAPHSPEPLGGSRYKVQFTAGPETHAKLVEAQALLRHQIPDGDLGRIFDRALDVLLREARRTKFAETNRPREARTSEGVASRHIPAAIRRAVASRDGERCTFVAPDGRRCGARGALEFHHLVPFARSRQHRLSEITLRCRAHNGHAAREDFGAEHMARFRREPASTVTRRAASDRASAEPRRRAGDRDPPLPR